MSTQAEKGLTLFNNKIIRRKIRGIKTVTADGRLTFAFLMEVLIKRLPYRFFPFSLSLHNSNQSFFFFAALDLFFLCLCFIKINHFVIPLHPLLISLLITNMDIFENFLFSVCNYKTVLNKKINDIIINYCTFYQYLCIMIYNIQFYKSWSFSAENHIKTT